VRLPEPELGRAAYIVPENKYGRLEIARAFALLRRGVEVTMRTARGDGIVH
jgi:hypothetical protein